MQRISINSEILMNMETCHKRTWINLRIGMKNGKKNIPFIEHISHILKKELKLLGNALSQFKK